jgi:hypothetical protein
MTVVLLTTDQHNKQQIISVLHVIASASDNEAPQCEICNVTSAHPPYRFLFCFLFFVFCSTKVSFMADLFWHPLDPYILFGIIKTTFRPPPVLYSKYFKFSHTDKIYTHIKQ